MELGVVAGVIVIGVIHGVLPDHGWPIAAAYALARRRKWIAGVTAGLVLGIGHLISSIALVLAYFWFSQFTTLTEGPWMRYVAGGLLVLLGVREYYHGQRSNHEHHHGWGDGAASEAHPTEGAHRPDERAAHHDHPKHADEHANYIEDVGATQPEAVERGLVALGTTALLLGFAHEEPIQILAICAGTPFCLELMLIYSLAVIVAILVPTLLLIAGYERHRETVEKYTPHLPLLTAVVLVGMGLAFITGVL